MGINISSAGTSHIKAVANKALYAEDGVSIFAHSQQEAAKLRNLFISMRFKDRKDSRKVYPADHPQHGQSPYDALETTISKDDVTGEWIVRIQSIEKGFGELKVVDNASGEVIKPEDLI